MNILITLSKNLLEKIISGEKEFEKRKCLPKHMNIGEDGFFVVEKGTDDIRCWCRVDDVITENNANTEKVYLWKIGKVIVFKQLYRDELIVDRNPHQFAYCPLSHGESF